MLCALVLARAGQQPLHISVEGWRFVPHSYAMVNQYQLLEMVKRPDLLVSVMDQPYLRSWWKPSVGLFSPEEEAALQAIPLTNATYLPPVDVVFRLTFPMNLAPDPFVGARNTWVFGTTEILTALDSMRMPPRKPGQQSVGSTPGHDVAGDTGIMPAQIPAQWRDTRVRIVTPSAWSRRGFLNSGVAPELVKIVPHGVDTRMFSPVAWARRAELRHELGWDPEVEPGAGAAHSAAAEVGGSAKDSSSDSSNDSSIDSSSGSSIDSSIDSSSGSSDSSSDSSIDSSSGSSGSSSDSSIDSSSGSSDSSSGSSIGSSNDSSSNSSSDTSSSGTGGARALRPFVFLSVGSTVGAKGIPDLLRAFLRLHRAHPQARLVLKLAEATYNSSLGRLTAAGSPYAPLLASGALRYIGASLTVARMAGLYQAADAYVSAYRGEGFNIPVLEAAACGALVVCTRGGATDDFITSEKWALRVHAELREMGGGAGVRGRWLVPDPEHLYAQMQRALYDPVGGGSGGSSGGGSGGGGSSGDSSSSSSSRRAGVIESLHQLAREIGAAHVRTRFGWDTVVEKLVRLFKEGRREAREQEQSKRRAGGSQSSSNRRSRSRKRRVEDARTDL